VAAAAAQPEFEGARPLLGVAFDGDLSGRPDALLAVALLNGLTLQGDARRISLSVSRPSLTTARVADVIAEFYPSLPVNAGVSTIGMPDGAPASEDAPALARMLATQGADGAPVYPSAVRRLVDTADNAVLIRNMILAEQDGCATIVLAGRATGLSRLLGLNGSRAQILRKVKHLVVAAGAYPNGQAEASIVDDVAAARRLFADWPTPLIAVGSEVGGALRYPGASIKEGLAWSATHPVAAAYGALGKMPYDAPTTALAAMLHAVLPEAGYFRLSDPGTISVLDDGRTQFTPKADGRHRYLIIDRAQTERLLAIYMGLVSATPAPRPVKRKPPGAAAAQEVPAKAEGARPPGGKS
jgi:hypothetical protein